LDAKALMRLLNAQRQRALQGQMPTANYGKQLQKIVAGALPRAQVKASAQQVGAQVANVGNTILTMGGTPADHHARALGNWQSDDAYDLMGKAGQPIVAPISGVVTRISGHPGGDPQFAGYGITVKTPQGDLFFKHLGSTKLKVGSKIKPGTLIGTLDPTVNGGPHLHLGGDNRALLDRIAKLYTRK
jgi:murein DD-endopeptidase MepM/ murein hydrolase activator NlpD